MILTQAKSIVFAVKLDTALPIESVTFEKLPLWIAHVYTTWLVVSLDRSSAGQVKPSSVKKGDEWPHQVLLDIETIMSHQLWQLKTSVPRSFTALV